MFFLEETCLVVQLPFQISGSLLRRYEIPLRNTLTIIAVVFLSFCHGSCLVVYAHSFLSTRLSLFFVFCLLLTFFSPPQRLITLRVSVRRGVITVRQPLSSSPVNTVQCRPLVHFRLCVCAPPSIDRSSCLFWVCRPSRRRCSSERHVSHTKHASFLLSIFMPHKLRN